jgi:hypothetical protein
MALKNYTSMVQAGRSIACIEDKLVRHGARQILKEYTGDGKVAAISFIINYNGTELPFHLPARIAACEKVLRSNVRRAREDTYKRIREQSERTAWKILADWVDAQMAMVELARSILWRYFCRIYSTGPGSRPFTRHCRSRAFRRHCPVM